MKTLLVLRHAKASQDSPSNRDFDRPLKPRGRNQSLSLGRMMHELNLAVDAIVASPAARVVETVSGLIEGGGASCEPMYDRRIYNASPESLLEVICEIDATVERLLIVGHNPGLQYLVLHLADKGSDGLRGRVAAGFPTATLAELRLSVEHWQDSVQNSGRIVSLLRPQD
ncbi:MAG: histidine phosphatase family protein [Sphingomicrobium sp.]